MMRIQRMRYGATRDIRYCLTLLGASLFTLLASGCTPDESPLPEARSGALPTAVRMREAAPLPVVGRPAVVFLGTSLTAGYGLREDQAFPALIQKRIDAEGLDYRVVNAGVSGDTSAGGLRRIDWLARLPIEVLVLELGANDMLRGLSVEALEQNLDTIIERTMESHPNAHFLIAGMRAAPNLGSEYRASFDRIYPALAKRHRASLIPFLLEDVAARRNLNQADGIHPTAAGHELIAERIWSELEEILLANSSRTSEAR